MVFRRRSNNLRPINSVKHIVEASTIIAAITDTVVLRLVAGVDTYSLADADGVPTGSRVNGFFLSTFVYTEGGEVSNEVPLVDWYLIHNPSNRFGTTFDAANLPTPGATGIHKNKRFILHTEKGLAGGGDASLSGVPMVFKGVIAVPKKMRRIGEDDEFLLCYRANFASKVCAQVIYKHYS